MYLLVKLNGRGCGWEEIIKCADGVSADKVAHRWAASTIRAQVLGRVPGHSYKVAESRNFVGALIESSGRNH